MESIFSNIIPPNHYRIIHCEFRTGIVTDRHGHRVLYPPDSWAIGGNVKYLIFVSLEDARSYARQKVVEIPEIECVILDDKKEQVDLIRNTEYFNRTCDDERRRNEERRNQKRWWKFW